MAPRLRLRARLEHRAAPVVHGQAVPRSAEERAEIAKAAARGTSPAAGKPEEPKVHNVDQMIWSPGLLSAGSSGVYSWVHPGAGQIEPITYPWLRAQSRLAIVAAWVSVRTNQVADFVRRSQGPTTQGVTVRLRDERAKMTRAGERRAAELREIIMRGGGKWGYGSGEMETRAMMRDSLILDQANAGVVQTRGGKPWGWVAADAATIRRALPTATQLQSGHYYPDDDEFSSVQINAQGVQVEAFRNSQMIFGIRRPRTDMQSWRYGWPEMAEYRLGMESLLNLEITNDVAITTGVHASSVMVLMSRMDKSVFRMVREALASQLLGVRNNRKTPIIQLDPSTNEELKVVPLGTNNHDMEFGKWLDYRIQAFCALVGIDRSELGITYETTGPTSSLGDRSPEDRNVASQERGLRPLLRSLASWWTHWLIEPSDPDFVADFTGLGVMSDEERIKHELDMVKSFKTVNEVRAVFDLKPLDSPRALLPLDPAFSQAMLGGGDGMGGGDLIVPSPDEAGSPDIEPDAAEDDSLDGEEVVNMGKGGLRERVDVMTSTLVARADDATRDGRIVTRRVGSGGRRIVRPSNHPDVKLWVVEV